MTNLDSILKSSDITLLIRVFIVKATVFPVAMYRSENCTMKKDECQRTDIFKLWWMHSFACMLSFQSCPTLCNPVDRHLPSSSVHGILQARTMEWVAISSTRGSSQPRDRTCISCASCISRQILYHSATWKASHLH